MEPSELPSSIILSLIIHWITSCIKNSIQFSSLTSKFQSQINLLTPPQLSTGDDDVNPREIIQKFELWTAEIVVSYFIPILNIRKIAPHLFLLFLRTAPRRLLHSVWTHNVLDECGDKKLFSLNWNWISLSSESPSMNCSHSLTPTHTLRPDPFVQSTDRGGRLCWAHFHGQAKWIAKEMKSVIYRIRDRPTSFAPSGTLPATLRAPVYGDWYLAQLKWWSFVERVSVEYEYGTEKVLKLT